VRRIGGRTEFDKHIAELNEYITIGEQHTDNTGSEHAESEHAIHNGPAGKHQFHAQHGCVSAIKLRDEQPVDHFAEQLFDYTEQLELLNEQY